MKKKIMLQLNHHSCVVAIFCCFHFHSFSGFFRKKIKLHSSLRISFVFLVRAERNGGVFTEGFYSWRWWKIGRNNLGIDLITKTKTSSKQQKYFPCLFLLFSFCCCWDWKEMVSCWWSHPCAMYNLNLIYLTS